MKKLYLSLFLFISIILLTSGCTRQQDNQTETPQKETNTSTSSEEESTTPDDSSNVTPKSDIESPSKDTPSSTNKDEGKTTTVKPKITAPTEVVQEFSVIAKKWSFEPSQITVNKGDKVKLRIKSIDVKHGISIPDFNISSDLNPNQETVIEFKADKAGTFSFFCSVYCGDGHKDMKGVLIVK